MQKHMIIVKVHFGDIMIFTHKNWKSEGEGEREKQREEKKERKIKE